MKLKFDSPLMEYLNTCVHFIALNLIFVICCLPIVTIGSAIAALYQVTLREARGEHGYLIRYFFKSFKEIFWQAFFTSLIFVVIGLILSYALVFWNSLGGILSAAVVALGFLFSALTFAAAIYVFPLMTRFHNSLKQTIMNAFLIALTNLKYTFLLLGIQVVVMVLLYLTDITKMFMLIIGFSFIAYCNSYILTKLFQSFEST
ncbi:DUF624 domain-containing protein [Lachnospiraceae bacterium OttesenSCG-928-D06]|nr:DUF624 domain-containing protein [Lachnospiraceae bacterium OttesenSCG-928-D06]